MEHRDSCEMGGEALALDRKFSVSAMSAISIGDLQGGEGWSTMASELAPDLMSSDSRDVTTSLKSSPSSHSDPVEGRRQRGGNDHKELCGAEVGAALAESPDLALGATGVDVGFTPLMASL